MGDSVKKNVTVVVMCLAILIVSSLLIDSNSYHLSLFSGNKDYQENEWFLTGPDGAKTATGAMELHDFEPGEVYAFSTELKYNGEGDSYPCAMIVTSNCEVQAYYDGTPVFHYTREDRGYPQVKSMGITCFSIPLGKDCAGKEVRLEVRTTFPETTRRRMPTVRVGDYGSIVHDMFYQNLPSMLINCAIAFVVIILIMLSNLHDKAHWSYISFAFFALLIIAYRATQDLFHIYMWGDPYMVFCMEYFSIAACPIPILLFYRFRLNPYYRKTFNVLITACSLTFLTQLVLHCTGIADIIILNPVTHLEIMVVIVAIFIAGYLYKKKTGEKNLFYTMIPILLGGILDVVYYYMYLTFATFRGFTSIGAGISLGLLISLLLMVWEARKERENNYKKIERNKLLEKMAYQDSLTGLQNRAAFEAELTAINSGQLDEHHVLCISADLNGLKSVNDSVGHYAGDELIRRTARVLNQCMRPYGKVFRTGGDEFFAVLYDVGEPEWNGIREDIRTVLSHDNLEHELNLSIAIGSAYYDGENIYRTIRVADRNMYKEKQKYHMDNDV